MTKMNYKSRWYCLIGDLNMELMYHWFQENDSEWKRSSGLA